MKLVAVEPAGSPLLSGGKAGPHGLMGIGANFIPKNMDVSLIDEIICVREEDAYAAGRDMVACEGVLVGITAGAALWAATQLALRPENAGKTHRCATARRRRALSIHANVSGGMTDVR